MRSCGSPAPQGGVVSPVLANLFLHYTFDVWMTKHYPDNPWCRYADDGLVHCRTEQEAQALRAALDARFAQCALTMHPDKTKVIYCKDGSRRGTYPRASALEHHRIVSSRHRSRSRSMSYAGIL